MATDPDFIKLSEAASRGSLTDMESYSGFSLSGLDVKPFPADVHQAKFVRLQMRRGNIIVASEAEYDEAREGDEELPEDVKLPHQEHRVREALEVVVSSGTPDSEPSSSSDSDDEGGKSSKKEKKGKKDKGKKKDKAEARSDDEPVLWTADELGELGQDDLKALLEANEVELEGRFSKKAAAEALLTAKVVKK